MHPIRPCENGSLCEIDSGPKERGRPQVEGGGIMNIILIMSSQGELELNMLCLI